MLGPTYSIVFTLQPVTRWQKRSPHNVSPTLFIILAEGNMAKFNDFSELEFSVRKGAFLFVLFFPKNARMGCRAWQKTQLTTTIQFLKSEVSHWNSIYEDIQTPPPQPWKRLWSQLANAEPQEMRQRMGRPGRSHLACTEVLQVTRDRAQDPSPCCPLVMEVTK